MSRRDLRIRASGIKNPITLNYTDIELAITNGTATKVPLRQVLAARRDGRILNVSYIGRKKDAGPMSLVKLVGTVEDAEDDIIDAWVVTLLHMVYEGAGVKRGRRLKVVINPHGGTKKGVSIFTKTVEPILRTAYCTLDVLHTTKGGHAYEIAKSMNLDFDAMVIVSGDGLVHEVLNGFAHHEQPINAFRIPLAPIPTGTGNGLSLNILGMADGFDVCAAALNVVKGIDCLHPCTLNFIQLCPGLPMKVDLFSLTQKGKRTISFMSQAIGLMADLDIGTENLRWMGDARFTYGLLRGMIQFKPCPVQLSYKAVEMDKNKMVDTLQKRRAKDKDGLAPQLPPNSDATETALPALKHVGTDDDGWTVLDEPLLYVYAGKGPYVGRDLMAFPVSLPDDGLIDLIAQQVSSRSEILLALGGASKGEIYWNTSLKYIKATAYRVKPLVPKGALAVDGEIFPFEEYQVEAHQGLATLLSPLGYYAADFGPRPPSKAST
ncbi:ATP-NAD kinase-like domain-containing protein [Mycena crocata]|nr:ATP-NAD kinase-like domain-containing protein [Mycena crocata]